MQIHEKITLHFQSGAYIRKRHYYANGTKRPEIQLALLASLYIKVHITINNSVAYNVHTLHHSINTKLRNSADHWSAVR